MGWAGTTLEDRRDARRARLLDVGLELLGTEGAGAVTVRAVCRAAKLTDRYFYESFPDREALLLAVFDGVADQAREALTEAFDPTQRPAEVARQAVEAFVGVVVDDPRKGRVLLLEAFTDPTLSRRGFEILPLFADLVRAQLPAMPAREADMTATAVIGALANLFRRWVEGDWGTGPDGPGRKELTDFVVGLLLTLTAAP